MGNMATFLGFAWTAKARARRLATMTRLREDWTKRISAIADIPILEHATTPEGVAAVHAVGETFVKLLIEADLDREIGLVFLMAHGAFAKRLIDAGHWPGDDGDIGVK